MGYWTVRRALIAVVVSLVVFFGNVGGPAGGPADVAVSAAMAGPLLTYLGSAVRNRLGGDDDKGDEEPAAG